jgi:predicted ATPase/DNA-binding winged helix-turn-helix (wHTH) protein
MNAAYDEKSVGTHYDVLAFGPFRLDPVQQVLREAGKPLRLGSRALEILLTLVEAGGETVGKNELFARVWPNSVIEEGTLRVHIAALRKILGDGESGIRYVQNVAGRGYRFAAPVTRVQEGAPSTSGDASASTTPISDTSGSRAYRADNLPAPQTRMLGRAQALSTLVARVPQRRFVTITGPGGIGKTTLALSVADTLAPSYPQGVCFVDLASLTEPRLVAASLASALGLAALATDPLPGILSFLQEKSMLLLLDNCEHVIEVAAGLVEKVLQSAPDIQVLTTSREPLRAKGESVHRLEPLMMPDRKRAMTGAEAIASPAVRLFVERAEASLDTFELDDAEVPLIIEICRRLDGNPLAIELAAAYVDLLGVRGLAASLDQGLYLSIRGPRTAAQRHQTLRATLDWSYELLSDSEQTILRRVGVFVGSFDLQSARAVAADEQVVAADVFEGLANLAAKSLLVVDVTGEKVLYRLLDMPRAYALGKLRASGEFVQIRQRHAEMWRTSGAAELRAQHKACWFNVFGRRMDDLRAALQWCFSPGGRESVGTRLTLASLWFECVLAAEYGGNREWAQRAIHVRPTSEAELLAELDAVLTQILPHFKGAVQDLTVAQQLGDGTYKRRSALWGLWIERLMLRDYRVAINISESFHVRSSRLGDDAATESDRILTVAHHYAGRQSLARHHAERVLRGSGSTTPVTVGEAPQLCHTRTMLAKILWVQGFADQAMRVAHEGISEAHSAGNPYMICFTLLVGSAVSAWCGKLAEAGRLVTALRDYAVGHELGYFLLWANCCDTALAVCNAEIVVEGDFKLSDDPLSNSQNFDIMCPVSEGLVSTCAIVRAEHGRGGWLTAEVLRVKGERMLKTTASCAAATAEDQFHTALHTARRQGALSFELRAAMSLARLWRDQHRIRPAHDLLASVYSQFTEGFTTADLMAAEALLKDLAADQ